MQLQAVEKKITNHCDCVQVYICGYAKLVTCSGQKSLFRVTVAPT